LPPNITGPVFTPPTGRNWEGPLRGTHHGGGFRRRYRYRLGPAAPTIRRLTNVYVFACTLALSRSALVRRRKEKEVSDYELCRATAGREVASRDSPWSRGEPPELISSQSRQRTETLAAVSLAGRRWIAPGQAPYWNDYRHNLDIKGNLSGSSPHGGETPVSCGSHPALKGLNVAPASGRTTRDAGHQDHWSSRAKEKNNTRIHPHAAPICCALTDKIDRQRSRTRGVYMPAPQTGRR